MMNKIIQCMFLGFILFACSRNNVVTEQNSLTLYPSSNDQIKAVRITVVTDEIIKVEASASSSFDPTVSLIDVATRQKVNFSVEEGEEEVVLSTAKLHVHINKQTGSISYFDQKNQPIIKEKGDDGRTMEPVLIDQTNAYSMRQQFDSPNDEALYGLGQHQANEMNYKGKNEELFQYNTKVSVPFVISTKNYGILWDNYSLTRFGDPRPYSNIDNLVLYDKNGKKGGLSAEYIDDKNSNKVFIERLEQSIDYENLETIANFPEGFDFTNAKITWEGDIETPESGLYRFICYYAGYTKLWIDGELQFDKWRTSWNPSVAKFNVGMTKGEKRHLKLEWIPDGGVSYIGLKALSPVNPSEQNQLSFFSEMGQDIRYYFVSGESMDEVISGYRTLTGKAQVMPKWSMGYWQSRERYKTQDELLNVLAEYRKRHIPIDNIVLDWSYWVEDQWGSHDFDTTRFPDIEAMIDSVHQQNAHVMISVWPKFYENTDHFKAFDKKGWMYRQAVQDTVRDWIAKGYVGSFYDAYNEEARQLFWEQIKEKLYSKGFDAWWLDATEPDILSNASMAYRKALMNPTALGSSTQYFNAYALMNAKGIYEGQRALQNDERVFILTRSGFAGIQRYGAVTWSGDIGTRWEDMQAQISAGINFAMSGLPYWTMDIGGFCVEKRYEKAKEGSEDLKEWRELNTRWFQFGAFAPLFRAHGQFPYREIFNIAPEGHPAYESLLYYDKLRYRLMPYIYSLAGMTYHQDYTMMRGLAMDFSKDKNVYNIGDQFMFGPSLMACPVYTYQARSRKVYLPKTKGWYNAYSGEFLIGGQTISANAPYEKMPVYVKAGSILPIGPEIEYTNQKPTEPITLMVYTGDDASFTYYEDEGDNYNYENGECAEIQLLWDEASQTLSIGERSGKFNGLIQERTFHVIFVTKDKSTAMLDGTHPVHTIHYKGEEVIIRNE